MANSTPPRRNTNPSHGCAGMEQVVGQFPPGHGAHTDGSGGRASATTCTARASVTSASPIRVGQRPFANRAGDPGLSSIPTRRTGRAAQEEGGAEPLGLALRGSGDWGMRTGPRGALSLPIRGPSGDAKNRLRSSGRSAGEDRRVLRECSSLTDDGFHR
jgi:hypothetical protein